MEPVKVDKFLHLQKAIQSGNHFIQVGERKFLLMEVDNNEESNCYKVKDSCEEREILDALKKTNPILNDKHIDEMLREKT